MPVGASYVLSYGLVIFLQLFANACLLTAWRCGWQGADKVPAVQAVGQGAETLCGDKREALNVR